ncbi:kinetochore-associated Ndc80 complex subunit nuf2, partial [Lunasporangiospora selenospora]
MAHETYHFPILKPQAIVSCMTDVQVPCAEEDLARPQPQKMLIVYEAFMDVATGSPKDDCYLDDIHEMNVATSPEFVVDSVRFYIFLNQLTNLMYEVGISDFTSRDVLKPEPERVRRILSAVINFAKFREDRQPSFFQELRKTDALVEMIAAGEQDHEQMILDLEAIKQQKQADMPRIEELKTANGSLATELDEYKKLDAELNKQLAEAGALRKALSERNQELNDAIDRSTKELTDIQAQRVDVPETLEQELAQIPESIQTLVQQVDQHRRLIQTRHAAVEKIEAVPKELYTVQELMSGTVRLMENYQEQASEVESIRSEIENRKLDSSTLTSKVDQTERLVRMTEDKLRTVRESTQQKRAVYEQETLEQDR